MGVREEIEKLPGYIMYDEKGDEAAQWIRRDKVLPILDECLGECVGEAEWLAVYDQDQLEDGRDWILLGMNMPEEFLESVHKLKPGDCISIYARKGK